MHRRYLFLAMVILTAGLWSDALPQGAAPAASFLVTPFASTANVPMALAIGPGGAYGTSLYVVERPRGADTGRLLALDPTGQITVLASDLKRPASVVVGREARGEARRLFWNRRPATRRACA